MSPHPGSETPPEPPTSSPKSPAEGPGFTKSKQPGPENSGPDAPPQTSSGDVDPGDIDPEDIDPEATEPFPPGLFRVPVPDRVFGEIPTLPDAALKALLALIGRSFRFDPEASSWTNPRDWFARRPLEEASGLSDEGTRSGLAELEERGWAEVDRSGPGYRYRLVVDVPEACYTYVPSALLTSVGALPSSAALRVLMATLRRTWGWTHSPHGGARSGESGAQSASTPAGEGQAKGLASEEAAGPVHQRWAEISVPTLAAATGRSAPSVRQAARTLAKEGWIHRVRFGQGAYHYRVQAGPLLPWQSSEGHGSKVGEKPEEKSESESGPTAKRPPRGTSFSKPPGANELTAGRQQTCPPSSYKRVSFREQTQTSDEKPTGAEAAGEAPQASGPAPRAVPESHKNPQGRPTTERSNAGEETVPPSGTPEKPEIPKNQRELYQKLLAAGIWPDRARECLKRYSTRRIEANFELWRRRKNDPEAPPIGDDGAWLCAAITDGYADLEEARSSQAPNQASEESSTQNSTGKARAGHVPGSSTGAPPEHKQKVSPEEKKRLVRRHDGVEAGHFHRFRHGKSPTEEQFLYLDPGEGGPARKRRVA